MKVVPFLLICVLTVVSQVVPPEYSDAWKDRATLYINECACATGTDARVIERFLDRLDFPDDPCLKCTIKCMAQKYKILDVYFNIVPEVQVQVVKGLTLEMSKFCANVTKSILDPCEMMYTDFHCIVDLIAESLNATTTSGTTTTTPKTTTTTTSTTTTTTTTATPTTTNEHTKGTSEHTKRTTEHTKRTKRTKEPY